MLSWLVVKLEERRLISYQIYNSSIARQLSYEKENGNECLKYQSWGLVESGVSFYLQDKWGFGFVFGFPRSFLVVPA